MKAIILAIGDELVLGQTLDTNSAFLSAQLAQRGIATLYHQTVSDDRAAIAQAIQHASHQAPLMIVSGGLGPTIDDMTRHALADALGVELVVHAASLEVIRAMMERRGRKMAPINRVQAMHPMGTQIIPNTCGTAPGITAKLNTATIYIIPGVPSEMRTMFELAISPQLEQSQRSTKTILTAKINTFGDGESNIGQVLDELCHRDRNPLVGTTVAGGIVSIRVRSEFDDPAEALAALNETINLVEQRLGPIVYGRDEVTLQQVVIEQLVEQRMTLATAESCTGGLLGKMLTDVPGSSCAYLGGWVTYANEMKMRLLGVEASLLEEHGAVSGPVVTQMAQAALQRSGADLAMAITGIAGPDGGSADKPVGTVWLGLASEGASGGVSGGGDSDEPTSILTRCLALPGDRAAVRNRAASAALQLIRLHVAGHSLDTIRWTHQHKQPQA